MKALAITAVALVLVTPSTLGASSGQRAMLFTGGGYGRTPETAIQAAIWDAETSASAYQLYTCQLVGEPSVFPRSNSPKGGPDFTAEATLSCTP